jgi:hypothetical protein
MKILLDGYVSDLRTLLINIYWYAICVYITFGIFLYPRDLTCSHIEPQRLGLENDLSPSPSLVRLPWIKPWVPCYI